MVIHDTAHGLTQLEAFEIEGCGYQAFLWEAKARTILVVAVYFKTNKTIQGTTNAQILARILGLLDATTRQFILVGDWNNHPEQFQGTVLSSKFHWQILAPDATLLNGHTVDYAIIQQTLAACTSMTTEWAVPWRPHCLLTYALELEDDFRLYHQLRSFPPLPNVPDIGFRAWSTYVSQVEHLQLYECTPNTGAQGLADWVSITEQYLLQQHPWAPQGRASSLTTQHLPMVPAKAGGIWKKGKAAFWEQIQARLSLIQHQPAKAPGAIQGLNKALQHVQHHWLGDQTWGQFLDTHHHWVQYRDDRTFELLQQTVQHQLEAAQQQSREESSLQYAEWIKQGETKGLKGLFRSLKASELSWQRPYRTIPMADRVRHRMNDWHQLWKPTRDNQPMTRLPLQDQAKQQAAALPPLTFEQLGKTLKHLPDKACGPDAITTQLLRTAPKQALQPLLGILQAMEAKAELPTQLTMSLVVMLAKNEKVERPITLTSVLYRVWCRMRKPILDEWQRSLPPSMDYDRARPGATALHVALERLLRQETAKSLEKHGVTVLLDMSTFYDMQKLQQTAQDLNYPPLALEFAMQVYTGHKAILAEGELSPWFHVTAGVAAGCPQAPLLAKTYLQPILHSFQQTFPDLHLNDWVDDIGFDGSHTNAQHLAHRTLQAWKKLRDNLTDAGLVVNSHKTAFIVTDKRIHSELSKLLGPQDPPIQSVMRDLGIDHAASRRRRIATLQRRFHKNKQRRIKLRSLKLPNLRTRLRLRKGGVQPVAFWGFEVPQPLQGHGCWSTLEPLTLQPWQGLAVTLDATPSSYDHRSQAWVFGLCIHTFSMGALLRKGTITGMAPGPQTKARALFQGLITLAQFVLTPTNVVVQLGAVWEAWTNPRKRKGFEDLAHGFDDQFFQRITPLYIHKNHRSPDTPANEPHLRRRQRDAALAAYERATTLYDRHAEDWQKTLDLDHLKIYKHAATRLEKIFKDPQHYIHDKPVRRAGHTTKQYKKRLINQCKAPWQPNKHQWVPHRSGYQCQTCHTRVHQALTVEVIEQHLQQDCELLTHEAPEPDLRPDKPVGQKVTRTTAIKRLLELQQQHPQAADEHTLQETTGYLKCTKCNLSTHKRTNEDKFQAFIRSRCIDEQYDKPHGGHTTHALWQRGKAIRCVNCGTQSHLDAEDRVILTKALTKECQGNTQRSPTLVQLCGTQAKSTQGTPSTGSQKASSTGHEPQPPQAQAPPTAALKPELSPPAPKKLRFSTDTPQPEAAQQAMTPSPEQAEEEPDGEGDPVVHVDFF